MNVIVTGDDPGFTKLRNVEMHVGAGIFLAGEDVVNDEAEVAGVIVQANVEEDAERIAAGRQYVAGIVIAGVFGRVPERVKGPVAVIAICAEIVNAGMAVGHEYGVRSFF